MTNYSSLSAIVANLPLGAERPITVTELEKLTGIGQRSIREYISILIMLYGVPVGASRVYPYGYYIIENETERMEAVRPIKAQIREMELRANRLETMALTGWEAGFQHGND